MKTWCALIGGIILLTSCSGEKSNPPPPAQKVVQPKAPVVQDPNRPIVAGDFIGEAIRLREDETSKPTNKAEKTDGFKVCFHILEDSLVVPGPKRIRLAVIDPDGRVIRCDSGDPEEPICDASTIIDYENSDVAACIYHWTDAELIPGSYDLQIWTDSVRLARTTVFLE